MKVLGIAGSPRRGGNTNLLLTEVLRGANSEGADVQSIFLNDLCITPCQHCDSCLEAGECKIDDDMQLVYMKLNEADRIVVASPIHFMGVTAQTKTMIDRCQSLWVKKFKLDLPPLGNRLPRKGLFVSVGSRSVDNLFEPALATIKALFHSLEVKYSDKLVFSGIDDLEAIACHPSALRRAFLAGKKLVKD